MYIVTVCIVIFKGFSGPQGPVSSFLKVLGAQVCILYF